MQMKTLTIKNIKIIIRVLPDFDIKNLGLLINKTFIEKLNEILPTENGSERIRLYPYFVYDFTIKKKTISNTDTKTFHALHDIFKNFNDQFENIKKDSSLYLKKSSLIRQIDHFCLTMFSKLQKLSLNPLPNIDYNMVIQTAITDAENKTGHIIMPAYDQPRLINTKQIPQDLLSENNIDFIIYVNTNLAELDELKKVVHKKIIKDKAEKSLKELKSIKPHKKGVLLTKTLNADNINETNESSSNEEKKRLAAILSLND